MFPRPRAALKTKLPVTLLILLELCNRKVPSFLGEDSSSDPIPSHATPSYATIFSKTVKVSLFPERPEADAVFLQAVIGVCTQTATDVSQDKEHVLKTSVLTPRNGDVHMHFDCTALALPSTFSRWATRSPRSHILLKSSGSSSSIAQLDALR